MDTLAHHALLSSLAPSESCTSENQNFTCIENGRDIGLALSGGGFRATLFHLGAVWRLNEVSLLSKINRISAVSGGSILSGLMAASWSQLRFEDRVVTNFREEIVKPIWRFCSLNVDVWATLGSVLPGVNLLTRHYQKHLVGKLTLQDIPYSPEFIFNAAHLETGRNWTFSKSCMRTYRLGIIDQPDIRLSKVIAASSAFPPAFSPVVLRLDPNDFRKSEFADLFDRAELKRKVSLTDGGVYDNLGVHSVRHCKTLLVSDASNPLDAKGGWSALRGLVHRSKRPIDIAVEQTKALRRRYLMEQLVSGEKRGALWTIGTDIRKYPIESPFAVLNEWRPQLESTRTRLDSFSDEEKARLINWGYVQCDLSVRSYYQKELPLPSTLPFPEFHFTRQPGGE